MTVDRRRVPMCLLVRPWTPDRRDPETRTTTITMKRACNGCGAILGDVSWDEVDDAIEGRPISDVRHECPFCTTPTATIECAQKCEIPAGVTLHETPPPRHTWSDMVGCPNAGCERWFLARKVAA